MVDPVGRGFARLRITGCFLAGLWLWAAAGMADASAKEPPTIEQAARALGRGINLGNALEAPKEGEWGVTLRESDFAKIALAGFQSVRLPVRWSAHAESKAPFTLDPAFAARIDWAVAQARKNKLNIIINMHHYEEMDQSPDQHKERLKAIWRQIGERYRDQPESVYFELFNEPHGNFKDPIWNRIFPEVLAVVRESNPKRPVIVGPGQWNGFRALKTLELPEEDRNLIVTFHYYEPFEFTHQGAHWAKGSNAWLGRTWTGLPKEREQVRAALEEAAVWGKARRRPIFLGEFGAYEKAGMSSRKNWTLFVRQEAERLGMSWSYWEYCSGFGAFDPKTQTWREEITSALLQKP